MEEEKLITDKILENVENKLKELESAGGVNKDNVDYLYKLIDIHKDIKNEKYWKIKEEKYNDKIQRKLWEL